MPLRLVPCLVLLNMLVERYVDFVCVFYVVVVLLLLSLSYSPPTFPFLSHQNNQHNRPSTSSPTTTTAWTSMTSRRNSWHIPTASSV